MRRALAVLLGLVMGATVALGASENPNPGKPIRMPQLKSAATIVRDVENIAHVAARNEHDAFFLQGWIHAQDRLFQMDFNRRLASGTLAELVGPSALEQDVTLRTIGLRRAAERSWAALLPSTRAAVEAYAEGVNAWVKASPLPPEYTVLEITRFAPWTPVDSVVSAKLIAFGLSFDLDVDATVRFLSYVEAGNQLGFDGQALYLEDLNRSAPFDPASTVPDATAEPALVAAARLEAAPAPLFDAAGAAAAIHRATADLAKAYLEKVRRFPVFEGILDRDKRGGSNLFAVSSALTTSRRPLIANDPHLQLGTPSTFYPMGLEVSGGFEVFGEGFPGVVGTVHGYNRDLSWGTTNNAIDVTDTYQEQVIPDPTSPSGLSTLYHGTLEWLIPIPEVFRINLIGDGLPDTLAVVAPGNGIPPVTLIAPRRNNGPIVSLDPATGSALSIQYTGFSPTRELDTFLSINRARDLGEFTSALRFFDFGSQNFVYADARGNIAYFTTGEMPVREDLQANTVSGLPPWFIRNGQGGNEWLPVQHPQPFQAVAYEVLPFSEMPRVVNPPAGFFVNANNDPAGVTLGNNPLGRQRPGGGIFYLAYTFDGGFRAGRIGERIHEFLNTGDHRLSFDEMQSIQADVQQRDSQVLLPYLRTAWENAKRAGAPAQLAALAADPRLTEAMGRLSSWSLDTATGIPEGYDAVDVDGMLSAPTRGEIDDSVATTIYSIWRSRLVGSSIDARLTPYGLPVPDGQQALSAIRHALDTFDADGGIGASGLPFFVAEGLTGADARDFVLVGSLAQALDLLAGDAFDAAFAKSTDQADYRWGKLHRIVFSHPLGGPFSIPPAGGAFPPPLPGLDGIPTDGGYQCVDASTPDIRGASSNGFMFGAGPVRRFVSEPSSKGPYSESIWPGGTSGVFGSPYYVQFLTRWLTDDSIPLQLGHVEVRGNEAEVIKLVPAPTGRPPAERRGPGR